MITPDRNRSFRLPRRVLGNRQNQSFPNLINLDKSLEGGLGSSSSEARKLRETPLPSAAKSSRKNSCTSSFWAELADEMLSNVENEGIPLQISLVENHDGSPKLLPPPSNGDKDKKKGAESRQSPLMTTQLVMNSSMNSVSVMNVSMGPIRAWTEDDHSLGVLDRLHDAMTDNMAAQKLLEANQFRESLIIYRKAIKQFVKICDDENRVVAGVNAASCYRNMSTAARMLKHYDEAAQCLARAVAWYLKSHALVAQQAQKSVVTLDGKMIDNSLMSPNKSVSSLTDTASIDAMLIEALHAQAGLHLENGSNVAGAFAAHDSVLAHLVEVDKLEHWKSSTTLLCVDGVVFTAPSQEQQTAWLLESLRVLGEFFMGYKQFSDTPLALFEKGIDILQNRFEESETKDDNMIHSLAVVLRYLSEIYFSRQLHDLAADALHDSASIKLRASGEPSADALRIMEKVGAANERAQCFDKARSCYEQIMMARSRYYGRTHLSVAKALFDIGRSIGKKSGSTAESDEILMTANSILALNLTEEKPELRQQMDLILQMLPSIKHFDRSSSVVDDLDRSLSELSDEGPFDKAQIFFDLGRIFMHQNNHSLASVCLNHAMKEAKGCQSDQAEVLLRSMQVHEEKEPSIEDSLPGEGFEPPDVLKSEVPVSREKNRGCERSAAKSAAFSTNESMFSEPVFPNQESSVFQETDPSIYIFEDAPSDTTCHQPIVRKKSSPSVHRNIGITKSNVAPVSLNVRGIVPSTKPPVPASNAKSSKESIWHRLLCPIWSTSNPIRQGPSTNSDSLKPIFGSQHRKKAAVPSKYRNKNHTRSKIVMKLCTIPESLSFGNENEEEETAAQCLLNSSSQSMETSSGKPGIPRETISFTMMGRKFYAAV